MEHSQTQQCRPKRLLPEKSQCSKNGKCEEQFDIQGARGMETEAAEFRDVVHQIVVLQVSEDVFVQAPAVRINKGSEQAPQRRYSKPREFRGRFQPRIE